MNELLVRPESGCGDRVGLLLSMMTLTRSSTRAHVADLTVTQLDWRLDHEANSVGMLLAHIAAVELLYTLRHLERREATAEEMAWLAPRKELGDEGFRATRGTDLAGYLADLDRVRERTRAGLCHLDDATLDAPFEWRGSVVNLHRQFFHVMEDELRHTGQIRFLLKRLPRGR